MRSILAIKGIGKGSTALTDVLLIMNVSYRGLHHKTFQGHINTTFRPSVDTAAASVSDAVAAVRDVYRGMDPAFAKNCDCNVRRHMDESRPHVSHWHGYRKRVLY